MLINRASGTVPAIILAGGEPDPGLAPGLPNKTFLSIGGRPLVVRVAEALRGCPSISQIFAVGPPDLAVLLDHSISVVACQGTQLENIMDALPHVGAARVVLVIAADLPLATSRLIEHFITLCSGEARLFYPIVPRTVIVRAFPKARKTYMRFREGRFCGGCLAAFDPSVAGVLLPHAERIQTLRKRPWTLWRRMLDPALFLRLLLGLLSLLDVERYVLRTTGVRGRAVILDAPELAMDVDDEDDMRLMEEFWDLVGEAGVEPAASSV